MNDFEEFGDHEYLVLTRQYISEIFSCCLRLAFCSSTFHQTNVESAQICSEDYLSVSRIRSFHLFLDVVLRAEEEFSVFLQLGTLDPIEFLVQTQSTFFTRRYDFCVWASLSKSFGFCFCR